MPTKIPATIVTGFLGAGKTTLIRHLLRNADGRRIALIVNEFGDLGVDGEILRACGAASCGEDDIFELSNGCICCTVADDFVPTLETILGRPRAPDHIVIETSGLALPQPLVRAFAWPAVRARVSVDGVVTVVDAAALAEGRFAQDEAALAAQRAADPNLDHESEIAELFEDQIGCADMIVLGKTDLVGDAHAARLAADLAGRARPGVRILRAAHGALPADVLLGLGARAEDDAENRLSHHEREGHTDDHGHDAFDTFVLERPEIDDAAVFADMVAAAMRAHDILRCKGFGSVRGKPMRLTLQAVGPRVETWFDRPLRPGEPRGARLVVIGEKGLDRAAIMAALGAGPATAPARPRREAQGSAAG
jgi:cobalamin biosynthesis protein CobW